jgi:hypothetical protein
MRDEIDSRFWVEHGADFSAFFADRIDRLVNAAKVSFERLVAIEFDAPWRASAGGR